MELLRRQLFVEECGVLALSSRAEAVVAGDLANFSVTEYSEKDLGWAT